MAAPPKTGKELAQSTVIFTNHAQAVNQAKKDRSLR